MDENKSTVKRSDNFGDEDNEITRHREMTEERKSKRKRILKWAILGASVAIGAGGLASCNYIMRLLNDGNMYYTVVGGAMGQWEEIPMQTGDSVANFNKVCERMGIS